MPTVLSEQGRRFFFYSLEGSEPPHIHVEVGGATAKFWLDPIDMASSRGFRAHELARLRLVVIQHRLVFLQAWHAHFSAQNQR